MFLNLGEVILCRRHPLGSNSEFPLASRGICSRAVPYVGCMSPSNVEGLPTVGTLVGMAGLWSRWLRGLALCGCYGQLAGRAGSDG